MRSLCIRFRLLLVLAGVLAVARIGHAQADATASPSPEPGDSPVVEKVEVAPETEAPVEVVAEPEVEGVAVVPGEETVTTTPAARKPIEQRVFNTEEVLRIEPKPRKNVSRIDNRPNRPKAKPIAVIKGPVSPWGYATRYMSGEVDRPAAKDLQGGNQQPGARASAAQGGAGLRLEGRRPRRGQSDD